MFGAAAGRHQVISGIVDALAMLPARALVTSAPNKWLVALTVSVGSLLSAIDISIVSVGVPKIRGALSATVEEITWVTTAYVIAVLVMMPLTAFFGTRIGRRATYISGLVLFVAASVGCSLAPTLEWLVAFRALQGLGGGVLSPTAATVIRETFPPQQQAMAMSLWAMTTMTGPVIGPVLGGYLLEQYTWPWLFYINIPIGAVAILLAFRFVQDPPHLQRSTGSLDYVGFATLIAGLASFQMLVERGERTGWFESSENLVYALVAFGSLLYFVAHELETPRPVVNLRVLKNRIFTAAITMSFVYTGMEFAVTFLLPLFLIEVLGYAPLDAGMSLAPRSIAMIVVAPFIGKLFNIISPRVVITVGIVLGSIACWQMSQFTLDTGFEDLVVPQILGGLSSILVGLPLLTLGLGSVPVTQAAEGSGLWNTLRMIGASTSLAIFASQLGRLTASSKSALLPHLGAVDPDVTARIEAFTATFRGFGFADLTARDQAIQILEHQVNAQARTIGFEREFAICAILHLALLPLVLLLFKKQAK